MQTDYSLKMVPLLVPEFIVKVLLASLERKVISLDNLTTGIVKVQTRTGPSNKKYVGTFLGQELQAATLPEVFAQFVDLVAELSPGELEAFSNVTGTKRRYVSQFPEKIHPLRPDLPVMQTRSSWWISKNIGQADLMRALRELAGILRLEFGKDIRFHINNNDSLSDR